MRASREETHVTTPILLDSRMTFRALLRVCTNPVTSLTIILTLLDPFPHDGTTTRSMIPIESTSETEYVTAYARDGGEDDVE